MILVLLGTFPTQFRRPLYEIERLSAQGKIREEIIVQSGHTPVNESKYITAIPFISPEELTTFYQNARIIISHAGSGSLMKGIKLNKKVIAIARLAKYGEVVDDHQLEILEEFAKLKYILPWREFDSLEQVLDEASHFEPCVYTSKKVEIINYLETYIDSL